MAIQAVDHITINCSDLSNSFRFYAEVLKLERLNDVDLGDHVLHYFQLPGLRLELIEYKGRQTRRSLGNTDIGIYRHIALVTDDLNTLAANIVQGGYKVNLPPTMIPQIGKIVMLVEDPNGVEVELIQA
jgi:lactoylglutathione lyase